MKSRWLMKDAIVRVLANASSAPIIFAAGAHWPLWSIVLFSVACTVLNFVDGYETAKRRYRGVE